MDRLLTPAETAQRLSTTTAALAQWRYAKRPGPEHVKRGSRVFYRESDVAAYIASLQPAAI